MVLTETNGDIKFYKDEKGKLFQQIKDDEIFKVKDGSISYKTIKNISKYTIKYNTNGVYGFSVFRDKVCLADRIWALKDAEKIASIL